MNKIIIDNFNNLITLYNSLPTEYFKENKLNYKINNFTNFILFLNNLNYQLSSSNDLLKYIDKKVGIGKGIIKRVDEIFKYGYIKELKYNKYSDISDIINKIESFYGISRSKAKDYIKKYNIININQFINLIKDNIISVPENVKKNIDIYDKILNKIKRSDIKIIRNNINKSLIDFNIKIKFCGSFRRKLPFSNDIDILIVSKKIQSKNDLNNSSLLHNIINKLINDNIIFESYTYENIITKFSGLLIYNNSYIRLDIRLVPFESYYPALLYFTGSKLFNINMRKKAKKLGYKLNEYGIYKNYKLLHVNSEKDIFKLLNISYLKPIYRSF